MKKKWLSYVAAAALVIATVVLIAGRIIPRNLEGLMPKNFQPESCHVGFFGWNDGGWSIDSDLSEEELQTLWAYLDGLEYRYDGRPAGGVMKGELYHLSFFRREPPEMVYLYITRTRGVMYLNHKEYEMIGNTAPLLEFLNQLR